jgi:hypothetical protein
MRPAPKNCEAWIVLQTRNPVAYVFESPQKDLC